jgi:energy-coupling factor transporter ATP-binding protein EcfA2
MTELHPSQLHQHLKMYAYAKWSSWGSLLLTVSLLSLGASLPRQSKPWILAASVGILQVGRRHRQTAKLLQESLGDIDRASRLNFQAWAKANTQPTAQLALTVGTIDANWKPENLITDPVEYIQKKQKHVALIGGTGDGKSTFTQYLSSKIGGRVVVYDSDAKPDDWSWLDQKDVIGRKGNFKAIDTAMGKDLEILEDLVQLRGEGGDNAIAGRERFMIAEEFPILVDECDNSTHWIKRHAKRGRRYKQFICALAQNDTAENFGLQGDKDTLYSCFCLVRLGQFGRDYARTKLKDPQLEQWLKAGGKRRFMVDDCPCELDLSNWGTTAIATPETSGGGNEEDRSQPTAMNEFEQFILGWGQQHPGEVLKARILLQASRLFEGMQPDEVRIIFASMADRGLGEVEGNGDRLGWRWSK